MGDDLQASIPEKSLKRRPAGRIDETAYISIECNSVCMIHSFGRCGSERDNALESSDDDSPDSSMNQAIIRFLPSRVAQAPGAWPTILPKQQALFL